MMRWCLFVCLIIALPYALDILVDYQFRQHAARRAQHLVEKDHGYTQQDRHGLDRLIDRVNGPGTAAKRHKRLSGSDERAALEYLWGDGQ